MDGVAVEMWLEHDRIVADTRSFQQLADADPDFDLGPMAPGLFYIDLKVLEADAPELVDAVAGSSTPDLKEMAVSLPAALITIEQTSTDPPTFVGTTTSARLIEALGGDFESVARCDAAELWMAFDADPDELAELTVEVYQTNTVDVVIELDERGLLSVLWTREDYSDIFRTLADTEGFGTDLSEEERREAVEALRSAELIMATRVAYEPDPDGEVPLPPPTTEDRTEEWRELLPDCEF